MDEIACSILMIHVYHVIQHLSEELPSWHDQGQETVPTATSDVRAPGIHCGRNDIAGNIEHPDFDRPQMIGGPKRNAELRHKACDGLSKINYVSLLNLPRNLLQCARGMWLCSAQPSVSTANAVGVLFVAGG